MEMLAGDVVDFDPIIEQISQETDYSISEKAKSALEVGFSFHPELSQNELLELSYYWLPFWRQAERKSGSDVELVPFDPNRAHLTTAVYPNAYCTTSDQIYSSGFCKNWWRCPSFRAIHDHPSSKGCEGDGRADSPT